MKKKIISIVSISLVYFACNNEIKVEEKAESSVETFKQISPSFNADSAYVYVKKQVDFGPRVPGTKAHAQCAAFFVEKLKSFKLGVIQQAGSVSTYDGKTFQLKNIIASYKPEAANRILLLSHWDSRPIADEDISNQNTAIDGADDGGSSSAVLLELARQISASKLNIGVDFFFSDLEDYGQPNNSVSTKMSDSWCLGTQYWTAHPHKPNYTAKYGILFDMVGAKGAIFPKEGTSLFYAAGVQENIWQMAAKMGYSSSFIYSEMGQTTDDHLYVNKNANIPCVDIVHMDPQTGTYGTHHHRHSDNIDIIDKNTMKMVGQVVMEVLWREK
jgi:Zn-dependent M28 family amino/carboxypeptidase